MNQELYKNGCWGCKRAIECPKQECICPKLAEHWKEYKKLPEYE